MIPIAPPSRVLLVSRLFEFKHERTRVVALARLDREHKPNLFRDHLLRRTYLGPYGCDGAAGRQRAAPIDDVIGAAAGAWTGEAQTGQSVGFVGASIFRGCPWGISCTAIVSASAVPLLRSVCSSLPPASTNPCPAV